MRTTSSVLCAALVALLLSMGTLVTQAQSQRVPARIVAKVDDTRTVELKGNVHPMARPEFDRGAVADSQPMSRMLLMLQRSPQQDAALQQLIEAQQTKNSGSYHAWLTPDQFGKQFGPSDADVQTVTDWLTRQGFQVAKVAAGKTAVEFSGTVAQVRNAFHTEIHKFAVSGETHVANVSEPAIPEALAPVVRGVVAMNDFPRHSHLHNKGIYRLHRDSGQIEPLFTYGNPANLAMAPADFNKIYNVPSSATGAGQTIAIIGDSNIDAQDVIDFRNLFGLPANFTQANNVLVNGPDPGLNGDEGEADLDVEWAGAIAPQANILLVTSSGTQSNPGQITSGIDLSALYVVDNDPSLNGVPVSVVSESFGECEPGLLATGNIFYYTLWQQAAAEGITAIVSTGDSGSAGCDPDPSGTSPNAAIDGLAVSGLASTPFNVAVGGTDFIATAQNGVPNQYWSNANGATNGSALQYIPETTWDDSACAFNYPAACTAVDPLGADLAAGSGGPSNCGVWTGTNGKCKSGYPIPAYQVGVNKLVFPNIQPTPRTIPDVSLFASNGQNGVALIVCEADANPSGASCNLNSPFTDFSLVGGTSAATPPFAAIVALLNQKTGTRQGNVNYGLYNLAANDANYTSGACNASTPPNSACTFNDVTTGNIGVACVLGSTSNADGSTNWCNGSGATFGVTVVNGTTSVAYSAAAGYDAATGLGSINVANLLNNWHNFHRTATVTTVSNISGGSPSGSNFTATVTVAPAPPTSTFAQPENVSLTALAADQTTILGVIGGKSNSTQTVPFALSSGTVSVQTNLLPPGTAYISASYGGDATFGASVSTPKALSSTVAGANFSSKTQLNFVTFDSNGNPVLTTQSKTVPYGSVYILNVVVTKSDGTNCGYTYPFTQSPIPCPTGTIALTDGGQLLNDFPSGPAFNATNIAKLSNQGGLVEDANVQLPGGSHSIVATFATADTNYTSGAPSNTLSVTITPATTAMVVAGTANSATSINVTAVVTSQSNSSQGPTGTVQFKNGTTNLGAPVTCTPAGATINAGASCTATLTTTIAALYPPPTNEPRRKVPMLPLLFALLSMVLFAIGRRWIPQRRRRAYVYAGFLVFALMAVGIAGCGGGGGSSGGTTITVNTVYAGDTNYAGSNGSTNITLP